MRLLVKDGYLITMDPDGRILDHGSLLIEDDKIVWVGEGDVPEEYQAPSPDTIIDASRRIVIPGLINCHLHSTADYWKGAIDCLPLEPFLLYAHPYAASLRLSEEQLYLRHMTSVIEMLESGTTAALDDTVHMPSPVDPRPDVALAAYSESVEAALRGYSDAGMRARVTCNVLDRVMYETIPWLEELLPPAYRDEFSSRPFPKTQETLDFLDDTLRSLGGQPGERVRLALAPNGSTRCTDTLFKGVWELAEKYDTQIVSHIQESKAEFVQDEMNYGTTAVAHLHELGVLDSRFGLIHAVWLSEEDLDLIADSRCSVITNPISNLRLGSGIAPVVKLLDRHAHVALGTDGPTANDSANLFEAMKTLAIIQRILTEDFNRWPNALDVLRVATLGGAYAFGESDRLGSLQAGMQADITLLDRDSIAYTPFHRPVGQLIYADTGGSVDMVLVGGDIVVEGGRVTKIPRDDIIQAFHEAYRDLIPAINEAVASSSRYQPYLEEAYRRSAAVQTNVNPVLWR